MDILICSKCRLEKESKEFKVHSKQCKTCRYLAVKEWRLNHPGYHSEYYHNHKPVQIVMEYSNDNKLIDAHEL